MQISPMPAGYLWSPTIPVQPYFMTSPPVASPPFRPRAVLVVPNGWELRVRLRSPSDLLPKINVQVNIQAPAIGPDIQLGWESRTLCVDDIQLLATDGQ
ncbi:hypothetical protein GGF31_001770 [Allomyces arbusculus]|nr:hypothetical protein GGF31_001770 [Allomyces arbusculus]